MPVRAAARPVVPNRGSRVGVRDSFLHVAQWDPGIERGGDVRMSERVGRDGLADPGAARGLADDPPGAVPVQPPTVPCQEHRSAGALADGQVDRPAVRGASGMVTTLPPLRVIVMVRWRRSRTRWLMSAPRGLRDPQTVQGQQGDQRMLERRAEPGGHQQGAELVAVQRDGVGLVVHPRTADVRRG
jgi:hypothetical protein